MDNKSCVFIGGKQIGVNCLKQLLNHNITPKLIIANSDDDGRDTWHESLVKVAKQKKLPVIQGQKVKNPEIIQKIKSLSPEVIFCIGGTQLIPKEVLTIPTLGCLNIHPAYLPKFRGRFSTVHAIASGEKTTGVTVHWMDDGIDSGPIIMQKKIAIEPTDTGRTLYDKFTKEGEKLFIIFMQRWIQGKKITAKPQNEKKATYYPKGLPNNGQINWNRSGKEIYNFIRAMTFEPFPPVSFTIGKKKMVIVDEEFITYKKI
jgi:methionyl-tRNA formyltransferase